MEIKAFFSRRFPDKECGRWPVIFYMTGYDSYIWGFAQGYPPRKLFGF